MNRIGVQLYTVRRLLEQSEQITPTLAKIKEMGYDTVQLAGSTNSVDRSIHIAEECQKLGLAIVGFHGSIDFYEEQPEWIFDFCKKYDVPDICLSAKAMDYKETLTFIERVNQFAKRVKVEGRTLSFHNHSHEFIKTTHGETVMQLLLEGFDKENVCFMPDTFWLQDGGADVRLFLENLKGRIKVLHLKDWRRTPEGRTFAEIGSGTMYMKEIIQTALACGIHEFVVEQDQCDGNPLDSLKQSLDNIKKYEIL